MRSFGLWVLIFLQVITKLEAQAPPSSANDILKEACQQAAREKKKVFILFHASWCGWCHKMDTSMNDPKVKNFFTDNYVIRHLVVYESKAKKQLENPGALELLKKYKGDDQGIPYWFIFDKDGKMLADSKMRHGDAGENTGCPASEPEVTYFISVLKQTSPLNDQQLKIIFNRFRENDVK
ncbi:MAG: thioredoxin family protein [Bacteroidota bacterium]|nr:thioredoxin family protein [Bacteroidota bacterium]